MNAKLIKEVDAPLLARKVLSFEINYSGSKTPSNEEVKKTVASLQKVKEELVIVKHIHPSFGKGKAETVVYVYNTVQDLKNYEPKVKGKKAEGKKEEKPKENVNAKEKSEEQKA